MSPRSSEGPRHARAASPRPFVFAGLAVLLVAALAVGVVTGFFPRLLGTASTTTTASSSAASTVARPRPSTSATPRPEPVAPKSVMVAAKPGDEPSVAELKARIQAVDATAMKATYSAAVLDVGTGKTLYAHRAGATEIPASTMKLLTSTAALELLGPYHRFTTSVVRPSEGTIILVGGGDPYLATKTSAKTYPARASVADLAADTASALTKTGRTRVSLGYDATLFTGPAWNPTWPAGYSDQVTPVSALVVDEGRLLGASPGPREQDPAAAAAKTFAAALEKQGIEVTKTSEKAAATQDKKDKQIASVSSMPLERIVEQVLLTSDNDGAENLFRHVALADGRDGSSADARKAVRKTLGKLGTWSDDAEVHDGSGLSRSTRVPAAMMADVLHLATEEDHPGLRPVVTGLPVAGVEGSLRNRFTSDSTEAGLGLVHAKTGTLRQVHSLAGIVRTLDGSIVVFAFLVNESQDDYAAKVWLERVTSAVASCGC